MIIECNGCKFEEGMASLSKEDREFFENLSKEANQKLKEDPSFDVVEFIYDKLGIPYIKKVREYDEIDDPEVQWFYDPFDKCFHNELDMLDNDEELKKYLEMPHDMIKVRIWRPSTMKYEGTREFKDLEDCINTLLDENAREASSIIIRRPDQIDLEQVSDVKWVVTIYDDYIE